MTVLRIAHPSPDERAAHGLSAREHIPLDSPAGWRPAADRPDPVAVLDEQNRTREPDLVPVRHGRMMASPFTFYRGAAKIMATDLKDTPRSGLNVQSCGDAHLSNFGLFASPERRLLFDLNDFDETLPGPFEYDVKRLAASFTIAARNNGHSKADAAAAATAVGRAYREAMAEFAQMGTLEIWYAHLSEDDITASVRAAAAGVPDKKGKRKGKAEQKAAKGVLKTYEKNLRKTHTRDSLQALSKLAERVENTYRIVHLPPVVVPARALASTYGIAEEDVDVVLREQFRAYRATLQ